VKRFLKEPLLHFLVLGALIFGAYAWLDRGVSSATSNAARSVKITADEVVWLKETWTRQWQREPTRDELRGLVTDFLKEELLAREARAMGLDENDTIVRRRLAQKLEFLVQDTSRLVDPSAEDLRRFYNSNPQRFQAAARITFTQLFFSPEKHKDVAQDAHATLAQLRDSPSASQLTDLGDRLLVDGEISNADEQAVAAQFGMDFARAVFALKPGEWQGPIKSGYGLHLVRVSEVKQAEQHEFAEVKAQVLQGWRDQRQREDYQKYFGALLKRYDVVVEDESLRQLIGPLDGPIAARTNGSGEEGLR
jgi:hypothetical protein